jgi:hypothetical protein
MKILVIQLRRYLRHRNLFRKQLLKIEDIEAQICKKEDIVNEDAAIDTIEEPLKKLVLNLISVASLAKISTV